MPGGAVMRTMLLVIGLWAGAAFAELVPQAGLDACMASPEWTGWSVRVGVVRHAEGGWSFAMEPEDVPMAARVRGCLNEALRVALDDAIPPAKTVLIVRRVSGPRPPADREAELKARFDAARPAISQCVLEASPVGAVKDDVTLKLSLDRLGAITVTSSGAEGSAGFAVACAKLRMGTFAPGHASVMVKLHVEGEGRMRRANGTVGSLCQWGQRHEAPLGMLEPLPCASGLSCCASGGAAGSDSVCMDVRGGCPAYP
jgi:hypothetical protein